MVQPTMVRIAISQAAYAAIAVYTAPRRERRPAGEGAQRPVLCMVASGRCRSPGARMRGSRESYSDVILRLAAAPGS